LPRAIEWLSDNGSGYIAKETKGFARDFGFEPLAPNTLLALGNIYRLLDGFANGRLRLASLSVWYEIQRIGRPRKS
jgi:transposase InsO family protein